MTNASASAASRPPDHGLPPARAEELARRFQALAHPVRLRLLSALAHQEGWVVASVELAAAVDHSVSTVEDHLRELAAAGLLVVRPCGPATAYRIEADALAALANLLEPPPDPSGGYPLP